MSKKRPLAKKTAAAVVPKTEDTLLADVRQIAGNLVVLQQQARELGLFSNDRELLKCPHCGLLENVKVDGFLFTCHPESLDTDAGLRFEELSPNQFRCPLCHAVIPQEANGAA